MRHVQEWIYGRVLSLYPKELRREFGAEMRALFAEDLNEAWRDRGFRGVLEVWHCAMEEVLRIALPELRTNPLVAVPCVCFTVNWFVVGIELLLHLKYVSSTGDTGGWSAWQVICGTSFLVSGTAIAVARAGKARVVSLGLR